LTAREQKLAEDRLAAEEEHRGELTRWTESETNRRKADLDSREAVLKQELDADRGRAESLKSALGSDSMDGRSAAEASLPEARRELEAARTHSEHVQADVERFVREACPDPLVVAGPVAAITNLGSVGPFDLLVLDDAHRLDENDLYAVAEVANRWVLLGEFPPGGRGRGRPQLFARLGSALRHDVWTQEESGLLCRLYTVRGRDRKHLECEPVADSPEIELRLYTPPDGEPTLAEVAFPSTTSPNAAREFLLRELGEVTCQPHARTARWRATDAGPVLQFASPTSPTAFAEIGTGVREELAGLDTVAILFDSAWSMEQARAWADEHLGHRDPGRSVTLARPYRACPGLALWLNRAFSAGFTIPQAEPGRHVEFLAVPDVDHRRRQESNGRPSRVGGAGYEIDLGDPRHRAAIPAGFIDLPTRGFINLQEAQALARFLEASAPANTAVTSPFPEQVETLRRVFSRSSRLAGIRILEPGEAVGHECDMLAVSLTRSHVSRAVTFGESPGVLASLLTCARKKVLFAGDPGTLSRRLQWEGPVDHLDAADAARERNWVAALSDCPRVNAPRPRPTHGESVRA
jgi:hypothetical protein